MIMKLNFDNETQKFLIGHKFPVRNVFQISYYPLKNNMWWCFMYSIVNERIYWQILITCVEKKSLL